jgi:hypothetical protein
MRVLPFLDLSSVCACTIMFSLDHFVGTHAELGFTSFDSLSSLFC